MVKGIPALEGLVCKCMTPRSEMSGERVNEDIETVEEPCYYGNALNASGGSELQ